MNPLFIGCNQIIIYKYWDYFGYSKAISSKQKPSIAFTFLKLSQSYFNNIFNSMDLVRSDNRFDDYIQLLKNNGAQISPKLQCAFFPLKNKLQYPGLVTTQPIKCNQTLVAIPEKLLLTAHKAQSHPQLSLLYQDSFYHQGPIWQDRILITYLLNCLKWEQKTVWGQMVRHFSKEIDIISFWQNEDVEKFKDKSVVKAASLQRTNFQNEWKQFTKVQSKYEILQNESIFNYQNYRWVYIHTISRCFGSFLNSTFFTPFCQFFNHNCVECSYSCTENDKVIIGVKQEQNTQKQAQKQNDVLSISSGNSEDYIEEGDYDYMEVSTYTIKWNSKVCFDLKDKQTKTIQDKIKQINNFLERELNWNGFTLLYIGQIIEKIKIVQNEYMAGRRKFVQASQQLQSLFYNCNNYRMEVKKYYENQGSKYNNKKSQKNTCQLQNKNEQGSTSYMKSTKPPTKNYKYMVMQNHEQQVQAYEQVYFCYGRLSNRTLLLRYGFCLQDNKYEHVWIRMMMHKELGQYPDLFQKMQDKGMPISYKIKLKKHVLNTQTITLLKMREWKLYSIEDNRDIHKIFCITDVQKEQEIVNQVIDMYKQQLSKYGQIFSLQQQNIEYHEYFMNVYHNQKIHIISQQIKLLNIVNELFKELGNKKVHPKHYQTVLQENKVQSKDLTKIKHYVKSLQSYI